MIKEDYYAALFIVFIWGMSLNMSPGFLFYNYCINYIEENHLQNTTFAAWYDKNIADYLIDTLDSFSLNYCYGLNYYLMVHQTIDISLFRLFSYIFAGILTLFLIKVIKNKCVGDSYDIRKYINYTQMKRSNWNILMFLLTTMIANFIIRFLLTIGDIAFNPVNKLRWSIYNGFGEKFSLEEFIFMKYFSFNILFIDMTILFLNLIMILVLIKEIRNRNAFWN